MHNFDVVVGKTDGAKGTVENTAIHTKRIAQVRPKQSRHDNRDGDQQAAHGRRARFFLMSLRTFFADVLPDLKFAQPVNDQQAQRSAR